MAADMGCEFRRQPAPERQALGRGVGFARARQHSEGQPALPQGADQCLDRGRERRQRARRRRRGAADGSDLLLGDDGHQRGDEISPDGK
jgi:hypothetical protein